jgi:hypothetical protein
MSEDVFYRCYYTKEFPVDEFGRPGGSYSLADLPVVKYDTLSRRGVIEAKNEEDGLKYKVRDVDENWVEWIPAKDVAIGDIHNGDPWTDWRKRKENYE